MVNYQALFEATPAPYLILDTRFNIVAVNNAYLKATNTIKDEIVGRSIFDVFPDNPNDKHANGVKNLSASLNNVLKYSKPDIMEIQKYDIPIPGSTLGYFEEKYWLPVNTPVFGPNQEIIQIIHRIEDITEFIHANKNQIRKNEELQSRTAKIEAEISLSNKIIRTREREIQTILEDAPIGMALVDNLGNFTEVNKSFCEIVGYTKTEIESINFMDITHPDDLEQDKLNLVKLLKNEIKTYQIEKRYIHKTGKIVWVKLTASAIKDDNQSTVRCISQIEDITQQKSTKEQLAKINKRNEDLLSNMPVGIVVHDPSTKIIFCNNEAIKIINLPKEEILGRYVDDSWKLLDENGVLIPIDKHPVTRAISSRQAVMAQTCSFIRKSSEVLWMLINVFPEFDNTNEISRIIVTIVDITEKKKVTEDLQQKVLALARSNEALDEFAYIASHDLKEPLRGISNYSSFLIEDYGDKLDSVGKIQLQTLQKLSGRLENLLNNLLTYSRISRIDLATTNCKLNEIIIDKIMLLETFLKENNAKVEIVKKLPYLNCDQSRIGQVFQNLITNGIKYNNSKSKKISIDYTETNDKIIFSVTDNGIGIPEEHYDTVFKMFRRLHARDEYGGGTGAGLTLTKKIIARHNGEIWVESQVGKSTTFYFSVSKNLVNDIYPQRS